MTIHELATILHKSRMRFCWGNEDANGRQHWFGSPVGKWPGDFGYEPQPWIDIAYAQAAAVLKTNGPAKGVDGAEGKG